MVVIYVYEGHLIVLRIFSNGDRAVGHLPAHVQRNAIPMHNHDCQHMGVDSRYPQTEAPFNLPRPKSHVYVTQPQSAIYTRYIVISGNPTPESGQCLESLPRKHMTSSRTPVAAQRTEAQTNRTGGSSLVNPAA